MGLSAARGGGLDARAGHALAAACKLAFIVRIMYNKTAVPESGY